VDVSKVAVISATFERCTAGRTRDVAILKKKRPGQIKIATDSDLLVAEINEKLKHNTLVAAVTE
jgi:hypothetical protein